MCCIEFVFSCSPTSSNKMNFLTTFLVVGSLLPLIYAWESSSSSEEDNGPEGYDQDYIEPVQYYAIKHFESGKLLSETGIATDTVKPRPRNVFQVFDKPDGYSIISSYPGLNTTGVMPYCMDVQSGCDINEIVVEYKCNENLNQQFRFDYIGPFGWTFEITSRCNDSWALTLLPDGKQVLKVTNGDDDYTQIYFQWQLVPIDLKKMLG